MVPWARQKPPCGGQDIRSRAYANRNPPARSFAKPADESLPAWLRRQDDFAARAHASQQPRNTSAAGEQNPARKLRQAAGPIPGWSTKILAARKDKVRAKQTARVCVRVRVAGVRGRTYKDASGRSEHLQKPRSPSRARRGLAGEPVATKPHQRRTRTHSARKKC